MTLTHACFLDTAAGCCCCCWADDDNADDGCVTVADRVTPTPPARPLSDFLPPPPAASFFYSHNSNKFSQLTL